MEGNKYPIQIWEAPTYVFGKISEKPDGMRLHDALDRVISSYYSEDMDIKTLEEYFDFLNKFMLEIDKFNLKKMGLEIQYRNNTDYYEIYRIDPKKCKIMKDLERSLGI